MLKFSISEFLHTIVLKLAPHSMKKIRIATRQSPLAFWQANHVKVLLETQHAGLECEIVGVTTEGDRNKVSPLSQMGGKGVFVKELETALLDGNADIAVHSMKDVPAEMPEGLGITAICERASPHDAFIANDHRSLDELPEGAVVGSSSLRRVLQIKTAYPHLTFKELRGNVDTRLRKLDDNQYAAIILAVAGLSRLGLGARISEEIKPEICLPAAGQGAVGIESRLEEDSTNLMVATINHKQTWTEVCAERRITAILGATCNVPIGVFAQSDGDVFSLRAFVSDLTGERAIRENIVGEISEADDLAAQLGNRLLALGAAKLFVL